MNNFQVQLVWNREFNWANFGDPHSDLKSAKASAIDIRDSGDGERVKKVQVTDLDQDKIVWEG